MGVLPLQFKAGDTAASLEAHRHRGVQLRRLPTASTRARSDVEVVAKAADGTDARRSPWTRASTRRRSCVAFRHGGILPYVDAPVARRIAPRCRPGVRVFDLAATPIPCLGSAIKSKARELGFDLRRHRAPLTAFLSCPALREWLDRGYAGEMQWIRRSARPAIRRAPRACPGARSVIVTGTPGQQRPPVPGRARPGRHGDRVAIRVGRRLPRRRSSGGLETAARVDARARRPRGIRGAPMSTPVPCRSASTRSTRASGLDRQEHLPDQPRARVLAVPVGDLSRTPPARPNRVGPLNSAAAAPARGVTDRRAVDAGVLDSNRCISYLTTIAHKPGDAPPESARHQSIT